MAVNPNLIDSDIFSSAKWQKSGQIEITPNYVTTPSFKRAHKLTNHNGDSDYLQYAPNSLPAGTYTLSIETKGETGNFTLEVDGPNWQGGAVITVNPTTGAVVTAARAYSNQTFVTAVSGKSFANPDTEKGGYIVSLTYTTSLAGAQPLLWPEAGKSVGVWGVKLENGTEATYATPGSPAVVEVPDEHDVRFVRHCGGIATADPNDTSGRAINDAALAQYYEVRKKFLVAASVLKMPVGYIHFSKTPRFINGFHHVKGLGGGIGGVDGTFIRVPGDQDGIQVDQANTNGLSPVAGPAHDSAAGSIFEGLGIWSMSNFGAKDPNTGLFVDPTYYRKRTGVTDPNDPTSGRSPASGILLRTRAIIRNCRISGFPGMGIYVIAADAWGWNGNANGWEVHSTRAEFCGDAALYIIGGDTNAGVATNFQGGYCGSWGVLDLSYLGHGHSGHQVENNGWFANVETMAPYPTTCWFNGKIYLALARYDDADRKSAIYGQSTPGQSPGVWEEYYTPAPADNHPTTQTPEWIAGQNRQFIAGGAYAALSPVGASGFYDCYSEGGQNPSDYIGKSFAMGGLHAEGYNGVTKRSNPCYLNGVWTKAPGVAPQ